MSNLEKLESEKVTVHKITEGVKDADSIEDSDRILLLVSNVNKKEFESIKNRFSNMIGYTLLYVEDINSLPLEEVDTIIPSIDGFLSKKGTLSNSDIISKFEGENRPFFCYSVENPLVFDFDLLVKGLLTKKMSKITDAIKDQIRTGLKDELFNPDNLDSLRDFVLGLFKDKDDVTRSHIENVFEFSRIMIAGLSAKGENLDDVFSLKLKQASLLHDLAKIVIPDQLLKNNDLFSGTEFSVMKAHVDMNAAFDLLGVAGEIAKLSQQHHYTYDNNFGYGPASDPVLKGNDIDPVGRMLCVIDSFEAMSAKRPYNSPNSLEYSFKVLYKNSRPFSPDERGTGQFDPYYAGAFVLGFKTMFINNSEFRHKMIERERLKGFYSADDSDEMIEDKINASLDSTLEMFEISTAKKDSDGKNSIGG